MGEAVVVFLFYSIKDIFEYKISGFQVMTAKQLLR
jgi:hypothetical protein